MKYNIKKSDVEEIIRQAKEKLIDDLADALDRKESDYFIELKNLSEDHTPREIKECFEKAVNEVNSQIFPSPPEIKILLDFNSYDNRFSVTLENEIFKRDVRPEPCLRSKPNDKFPHFLNLYIRDTVNAPEKYQEQYQEFLRDIFQELIFAYQGWIKNRLFGFLKDIAIMNRLYSVFSELDFEKKKDILEELYFVPVVIGPDKKYTTYYLINPLAAENVYEKFKKIAPKLWTTPIALLVDLARTPIPYNETFARVAEGKEKPEKVRIDKSAKYQNKRKRFFQSEKAVMGNSVYAYEVYDAGDGHRLFAEYPAHRDNIDDITDLLTRKKPALQQAYDIYLKTINDNVIDMYGARKPKKTISPKVSAEIKFIVDEIINFAPVSQKHPYIFINKNNSLVKGRQNDKVSRRNSLLSSISSFLPKMLEKGLNKGKKYREEQEDLFIKDIIQIMAENGLSLTPYESAKITAEIRAAIDKSKVLRTLGEDEQTKTEKEAVQTGVENESEPIAEESKKTPYDYHKLTEDWKQNRIQVDGKTPGKKRWQNVKEYLDMIYGEAEKQEYGELCLSDLRKINSPLCRSLENFAYHQGKKPNELILTVPERNTQAIRRHLAVVGDKSELRRLSDGLRRRPQL
jgi:hypothetical protein